MATLFKRPSSAYWWINYTDADGRKIQRSTKLRCDSPLETRKAQGVLADRKLEERMRSKTGGAGEWSTWVEPWITSRYEHSPLSLRKTLGNWANLRTFLLERRIKTPSEITRGHCFEYVEWRRAYCRTKGGKRKDGTCKPGKPPAPATITGELKTLAMIMDEAIRRDYVTSGNNPARRLGLSRQRTRIKPEITPDEEAVIREALLGEKAWMLTAFSIAMKQGCRLKETAFHLYNDVDLEKRSVTFHAKGNKTYTTSLHPDLIPLVEALRAAGRSTSWDWYQCASRDWTRFFRKRGMRHLCFHCTRVTAITRCARAGVPLAQALRFFGHASTAVHETYQRLTVDDVGSCIDAL